MALALPKDMIRYVVDKMHVGTSDAKVRYEIRRRTESNANWTPALVRQAENYAVKVHHDNQKMYAYVMGGSVGLKRNPKRNPGDHRRMLELEYRARHGAPLSVGEAAELKRIYDRLGVGFLHRVALRATRDNKGR